MEVVTGPLPSVITKLGNLIAGEYNLQKGLKGEIRFLKGELESMQVAVKKVSNTLPDQLDEQDKIWARDLRELSYDIEDKIDTFIVRIKGNEPAELNGVKRFIGRSVKLFSKFRSRHGLGTEIRDTKMRLDEVYRRFQNLKVRNDVSKPVPIVDPRVFSQYKNVSELVGIHEAKEEVIKILMEGSEVSKQQNKIVSIVGFGGLGKTTIAYAVYQELKTQFHCSAFVSVSQTPDTEKLLKEMLKQLGEQSEATSIDIIVKELTEFLQNKRYLIVLDDIWCLSFWKNINSALPNNGLGNRIIITTRSADVAEKAGGPYKLKPLSLTNSRKLFYGRVFGNESNEDTAKCPDMELVEVSDKILKKCAGVPLAIITMASLLALKGRDKLEWYELYNLVGTGLEKNPHVDDMRKILSFSYYDMPSRLRTCLLYLSMFPEDSRIGKSHLIQLWISEGFIQCTKPGESLIELGETYLNELINRSMIQPEYDEYDPNRLYCRVHDMVLDLLRTLSSEENFVTILNDVVGLSLPEKVRRLSLQNSTMTNDAASQVVATMSMKQMRSVVAFGSPFEILLPALSRFRIVRVLDLEECDHCPEYSSLKYLGNLVHLRYLGLGNGPNMTEHLPEEIGKLGFLQTLVLMSSIDFLPSSIVQLKHLICVRVSRAEVANGNGIGKLTCLEELSGIYTDSIDIIKEIGNLTELRVLAIWYTDALLDKSFVECLCKLQKLQSLKINSYAPDDELILDSWVAPQYLHILEVHHVGGFSTLPAWMNPSFLQHLCSLRTYVKELSQEDFEILGKLPALRFLSLRLGHERAGLPRRFTAAAGSFPCLVMFWLHGYIQPLEFQQGAMPRLETIVFWFHWPEMIQVAGTSGGFDFGLAGTSGGFDFGLAGTSGGFDFGLRNLSSLKYVTAHYSGSGRWKEAADALWHELETHPNQPTFHYYS